jgi:hypothetical protein
LCHLLSLNDLFAFFSPTGSMLRRDKLKQSFALVKVFYDAAVPWEK